nr:PRA1 family protein D-like [Tanacetum cinerariifolium]GEW32924.1 PRA1 family protein D-like [Tanacetum cinerariifolium]
MTSPPPATNTYSATATIRHSIQPWPTFFSPSSLSLPLSLQSLSNRFTANLLFFRGNYVIISLLIFILSLITHPFTAVFFIILIAAWVFLFFARDDPFVVFDFELGDKVVLIGLGVVTVVGVAVSGIWWNLLVSVLVSGLVVSLHAVLRAAEGDGESPYGALLSVVDDDLEDGGSYMPV